ncbi:MAG: tetratricopeptide repeat protein [Myxococcaceae bacterium]
MRQLLAALCLTLSIPAFAADPAPASKKEAKDADLGKKETSIAPDKSLAGDITRKKEDTGAVAPVLQYDQFRLGVELQVASKRHEQIESLKKIIDLGPEKKEAPSLYFRLGELYFEESKYWFFEANRKDDDYIQAMNRKDQAGMDQAKAEKQGLVAKSKEFANLAVEQYSTIVQQYKDFERTDEVLFFLGQNLMEQGEDKKALVAYKRLVEKYQKSKYIPEAQLAFGEYYFNNSKGKRDMLEKALAAYKVAASYVDSQIAGYALYKQGWCLYNMGDFPGARDMFKQVILLADLNGAASVEKETKGNKKTSLVKEARGDFVRAYGRDPAGSPSDAKSEFSKVAKETEDRFNMLKQLANIYYEDGKDREAALVFNGLIQQKPLSPEAPGWQGKIVDCVLRAGNKKMTVDQVRRLVKITDDVNKGGQIKSEKDKQSLSEAQELSERTLSNLAVNWHNEAKKTRDEQTFFFANEVYADYLTLFPNNVKSYDLRFFWAELLNDNLQKFDEAAQQYTLVLQTDIARMEGKSKEKDKDGKPVTKPGKFMTNAAYNAILAYDEVVKAAEQSGSMKTETTGEANKAQKIPAQKQALLDACERYLKYVPTGDKTVEIAFKAANIYYRYNHFDEAVKRFAEIAEKYPEYKFENGDRAAEIAANLILDSYNLVGDWAKVNEWARKFYSNEKLATGKFREDLSKVLEQSSFKLVNQLEANKEFNKAGEAYLTFVSEFPKSEIADKALYNASIDFFNAHSLDKAISVRERIITQYPKSEYVPACMYANAEALEAVADFEPAAKAYESYVNHWERANGEGSKASKKGAKKAPSKKGKQARKEEKPEAQDKQVWDEAKSQIALYNAGVFRDGLGQYKQALKDREHYLELWPDNKDAEAVFLSIADLHEKYSAYGKAMSHLEEFEKKYGARDPNKMLAAEGRIERIYTTKLHKPKDAQRINKRVLAFYEKLSRKQKDNLDVAARDAVGRANYEDNADQYAFYSKIKINWGNPASPQGVKKSIQEKAKSLQEIQRLYTETVKFKAADPAICALHQIGLAYANMAESVEKAPVPKKIMGQQVPPELEEEIKTQFAQQAAPMKDKAAEAFAAAVGKSHELDVMNDCSRKSLELLRTSYKPEQFPAVPEQVEEIKGPGKTQAVGGDLLASIQPIPVVTAAEAKVNAEKVQTLKESTKDLPTGTNVDEDSPPPATQTQQKSTGDETKEKKKGSDEPEDVL